MLGDSRTSERLKWVVQGLHMCPVSTGINSSGRLFGVYARRVQLDHFENSAC